MIVVKENFSTLRERKQICLRKINNKKDENGKQNSNKKWQFQSENWKRSVNNHAFSSHLTT